MMLYDAVYVLYMTHVCMYVAYIVRMFDVKCYMSHVEYSAIQLHEQKLHNAYYDALILNDTIRYEMEKAASKVPSHVNLTLMVTTDDRKIADAIEKVRERDRGEMEG